MDSDLSWIDDSVKDAVSLFWRTRLRQTARQSKGLSADRGARAAVTGGKQMDGFVRLLCDLAGRSGVRETGIFCDTAIELPGYFRPTKQWDMLIVVDHKLLAAIELKSQVGPSFGNNFNNRTEEAIGSAVDLWTAFREGAFLGSPKPWLGYVFLLEDCEKSRTPVRVEEPHFKAFPEFKDASYMKRYEILCRRLVLERHYDAAAFVTSSVSDRRSGAYGEPAADLTIRSFAASLMGAIFAGTASKK